MLHDFYVKAKAHCGDMRLLMVTGVSKFAKTSIFSAFNNPVDLSLDARAADLVQLRPSLRRVEHPGDRRIVLIDQEDVLLVCRRRLLAQRR